ncbi:hypothetical protein AB0I06_09750 [Streptomyces sp. NPDC050674]
MPPLPLGRGAADRLVLSGPARTALTRAATAGRTLVVVDPSG